MSVEELLDSLCVVLSEAQATRGLRVQNRHLREDRDAWQQRASILGSLVTIEQRKARDHVHLELLIDATLVRFSRDPRVLASEMAQRVFNDLCHLFDTRNHHASRPPASSDDR